MTLSSEACKLSSMPQERERAAARPVAAEPSELRARILAASIALIEEEGLARLSMREVARRAGVTHQAPYHYFADREAILGEIAAQGFRMLSAQVQHALGELGEKPGTVSCLETMGRAYVEFAFDHPAHFRIMFRPELVDLDNCPEARAEGDNAFCMLKQVVHEAVLEGLPAVPSETALVAMIWSVAHGLACLLLDGSLATKFPDASREAQIQEVISAFGAMVRASMTQREAAPSARPSAAPASRGPRTAARRAPLRRKARV